jgi:colanic acid biosynthesis protein WcaH
VAPPDTLISPRLYRKISSRIPILCVDLLIKQGGLTLLVKRKKHPMKGQWWVVGGRVFLGEDPYDAAIRKAKEEVGLDIWPPRFVGFYSDIYERSAFEKTEYQTVSLIFECDPKECGVTLDSQSSDYKWSDTLPERFASKIRQTHDLAITHRMELA